LPLGKKPTQARTLEVCALLFRAAAFPLSTAVGGGFYFFCPHFFARFGGLSFSIDLRFGFAAGGHRAAVVP